MNTHEILLSTWDWKPFVVVNFVMAFVFYGLTCRWNMGLKSIYFLLGWGLGFVALASPIDFLARTYLFSAHMLQHLLLVMIVPPLILLSLPTPEGAPPPAWIRNTWVTWFFGLGAMWLWHIPAFCDAAASNRQVHALQSISLLLMGSLFWRPIVGPRISDRLAPLSGILYLLSACIACSLLGIWISFAPLSVCPVFMHPMDPMNCMSTIRGIWGLTPIIDQQIGGLLMWVPTCFIYLGAIMVLLSRLYRKGKRND